MLTVEHVETIPFRLPLHEPLHWGKSSVLQEVHHVLVRVVLSDGAEGWGEAPPRPTIYGETVHSVTGIIEQEMAPRILGEPLNDQTLPRLYDRLAVVKNNQTARGALDMALHDALAASRGTTLARHLDAEQKRVQVSYILGIGDRDTVLAEAERVVQRGVGVLKVKIGRDWPADRALLSALGDQFGSRVSLYVDANETLTGENGADRLRQLAEMGVLYCEEPLPVHLVRERARLAAARPMPLIADDSAFSLTELHREMALETFHILNIKTARTGYSESTRMWAAAREAGRGVMVGSQASSGLGTVRAALFAGKAGIDHPCELSFFLKLKEDLLNRPLTLRAGYLHLEELDDIQIDRARLRGVRSGVGTARGLT